MANYIDAVYDKKSDPKKVIVFEQDYENGNIVKKSYKIEDYIYFYIECDEADADSKSMTNKYVKKIYEDSYKNYASGVSAEQFRKMGIDVFESDIEPLQKCLFDNYGMDNQKQPDWNIALYDIEVDVNIDNGFPDPNEAATAITAVSVWYKNVNEVYVFTLVPPNLRNIWNFENNVEKRGLANIIYFDDEKEMLLSFFEISKELNTMAFGAWNGDFFDTPYIFNRLAKLFGTKKKAAQLMGDFDRVTTVKSKEEDKNDVIRPIGRIWYDALLVYKSQAGEKDSYNLNSVAEDELGDAKIEFFGNFEDLYLSTRQNRDRFTELDTGIKGYKKSKDLLDNVIDELELKPFCDNLLASQNIPDEEYKTKINTALTEELEKIFNDDEIFNALGVDKDTFELGLVYRRMFDTYSLFLDYSAQDSILLKDLETETKYFNVLMMLAQYNVSFFHDTFSTLKQVENGIANFAHIHNNQVVIDREYDILTQSYNEFVDPDILEIRNSRNYKYEYDDNDKVKEIKSLISQTKIPGAHVLLPQIGLIAYDEKETPPKAKELKKLNAEYHEILDEIKALEKEYNQLVDN